MGGVVTENVSPVHITSDILTTTFPDRTCSIDSYGAKGDGLTKNTSAIRLAIEDCVKRGGGTISIPKGRWLTGPIHLKSNIHLYLSDDAELLFSQSFSDYLQLFLLDSKAWNSTIIPLSSMRKTVKT